MGIIKTKFSFIIFIALILTLKGRAEEKPNLDEVNMYDSLKNSEELPADFASDEKKPEVPEVSSDAKNEVVKEATPKTNEAAKEVVSEEKVEDLKLEPAKKEIAKPSANRKEGEDLTLSSLEEQDDLQSLKEDVGEVVFGDKKKENDIKRDTPPDFSKKDISKPAEKVAKTDEVLKTEDEFLDKALTEDDEKKLLSDMAKKIKGKINNSDWTEISKKSRVDKYEVKSGDTLKSISKTLFGTEDYYAKIWALNPQVTNPNILEAGTVLTFDSGDLDAMPTVTLSEFSDDDVVSNKKGSKYSSKDDINQPAWIKERKKLIEQGVYFQFASEETYEDLERLEREQKNNEWEKYDPPVSLVEVSEPNEEYDSAGFNTTSKIVFNYKEGFFLNTFISTNVIQDLGEIYAAKNESVFMHKYDTIYVKFDRSAKVKPGDYFSVYTMGGEVKHPISDRSGFSYTTTAQIKAVRKIDDVWECYVFDQSGIVQRKDRITVYTPKIGKIARTFGKRNVEAAIIASYRESLTGNSYGDVVYLDRGRADGVELGNIFEVYSFVDRGTDKKITPSPTYKIGELTVINITDNFATALVTSSKVELPLGSIAMMKTQEEALRAKQLKNQEKLKDKKQIETKSLDELDVELNLDDVSQDILNKADKVQLTEDEIEELDRQERDKSVIKNQNRDVKELDRLESEILDSEKSLNESKVDEDKFLEQQSLEVHERKAKQPSPNAFESINEIEKDIGKKYLDEDINNKENPYGLTEFDLEEIDELLNTGAKSK